MNTIERRIAAAILVAIVVYWASILVPAVLAGHSLNPNALAFVVGGLVGKAIHLHSMAYNPKVLVT